MLKRKKKVGDVVVFGEPALEYIEEECGIGDDIQNIPFVIEKIYSEYCPIRDRDFDYVNLRQYADVYQTEYDLLVDSLGEDMAYLNWPMDDVVLVKESVKELNQLCLKKRNSK